jgi:uncharacterized protein (TIGR03084 family)
MVADLATILADLDAESKDLDRLVADLDDEGWARPTPAEGWTIAHQIAHLHWTDKAATLAAADPQAFTALLDGLTGEPDDYVDRMAAENMAPGAELLVRWRDGRARLAETLAGLPPGTKVPWFSVAMSPPSIATGRVMETWAHGEDVAEALGVARLPTNRLRHVAFLGYRAIGHSFLTRGRPAPAAPVYVELRGPDGGTWAFGPPNAADRVIGQALDFCRLVTQRSHPADLALAATGPVATEWLSIAQAFAGPPGKGRQPTEPVQ